MKILIFSVFCFTFFPLFTFSQATFIPNQEEYLTIEDWKDEENWTYVNGNKENNYPSSNDIILTQNTRLNIEYLRIGFNLDQISTQLTYTLDRQNFRLVIDPGATVSFKIDLLGNITTSFEIAGHFTLNESVTFNGSRVKFTIDGTMNVTEDITFNNANNQFVINEGGIVNVNGDFNSLNGGSSTYSSDGELIINGDYRNDGKAVLEIGENGSGRIKGNIDSNSGGGGTINVYGLLHIENSVDFFGKETLYVDEKGCLVISGNVFLTCNKDINANIYGKVQFGSTTKCSITDDENCRENSPNNQICEKINDEDLPVELTYFYGIAESGQNTLYWETASEINNSHFEIQNSNDEQQWITLDTIQGAGNINTKVEYSYVDSVSLQRFYRLKQVDFDGNYTIYGPINIINNSGPISGKIYPNIVTNGTTITVEILGVKTNSTVKSFLISSSGQIIDENILSVNIEGDFITNYTVPEVPSPGIYIFRILSSNSTSEMKFYVY
ncbi:hypothetical protein [Flammeovirga sp. EKP202]|uniref:hypothetical protein n=1 Tax=Flammeovirga sp. EKP202 TaxID=2770592 RepID=UPI00165FFDD4|nr:hypothetical protein [Flammeovirga sp. EKP202]MBD0401396.1 hypothetical protein [Flammeovirga sp. EKP202]